MRMPFGKHRGAELRDLPSDYLQWLTTIELRPFLRDAVDDEIERREFSDTVRYSQEILRNIDAVNRVAEERRKLFSIVGRRQCGFEDDPT